MNGWGLIVVGIIAVLSGVLQFRVWRKLLHGEGWRTVFWPPFFAAGVVGAGAALYAVFRWIDPGNAMYGKSLLMGERCSGQAFSSWSSRRKALSPLP
jgi:hypothetical protein